MIDIIKANAIRPYIVNTADGFKATFEGFRMFSDGFKATFEDFRMFSDGFRTTKNDCMAAAHAFATLTGGFATSAEGCRRNNSAVE